MKEVLNDFLRTYLSSCDRIPKNPGLINGELGLIMNLYYLSDTDNSFKQLADERLDRRLEEINLSIPPWFDHGILGMGWGLMELVKNKFIEADIKEVFIEVDAVFAKIHSLFPAPIGDRDKGLIGKALYLSNRLYLLNDKNDYINLHLNAIGVNLIDAFHSYLEKVNAHYSEATMMNEFYLFPTLKYIISIIPYPSKVSKIKSIIEKNSRSMNPNLNNNFDSLRLLNNNLFLNEDEFDGLSSNVLDILCQKELSDALKIASGFSLYNAFGGPKSMSVDRIYNSLIDGMGHDLANLKNKLQPELISNGLWGIGTLYKNQYSILID